jgi:hypothetical protein
MDASLQFSCTRRQFGEPTLRIAWHPGKLCTPVTRYESLRLKLVQSKVCNKLREQTSSTQITGDSKLNPARPYYRARRRKTHTQPTGLGAFVARSCGRRSGQTVAAPPSVAPTGTILLPWWMAATSRFHSRTQSRGRGRLGRGGRRSDLANHLRCACLKGRQQLDRVDASRRPLFKGSGANLGYDCIQR